MSARVAPRSIALDDSRPIWQSLAIFLGPLMLSNVLQSLSQTANSVYLGRLVGVRSLAAVSAIASWVPAWRAARVDPSVTLRAE